MGQTFPMALKGKESIRASVQRVCLDKSHVHGVLENSFFVCDQLCLESLNYVALSFIFYLYNRDSFIHSTYLLSSYIVTYIVLSARYT